MNIRSLPNCKNCGAVLADSTETKIICPYCGTIYREVEQAIDNPPANNPETDRTPRPTETDADKSKNKVAGTIVLITILFVIIGIAIQVNRDNGRSSTTNSDSVAVDTSDLLLRPQPAELSDNERLDLKTLAKLEIDRSQFIKLYRDSSVTTATLVFKETFVKDKNSIAGKPISGLYTNIEYNEIVYTIFLGSQHIGKEDLKIESLTFVADGIHTQYEPYISSYPLRSINEWSYEANFAYPISMLFRIATADKVIIYFNDKDNHKVDQMALPKDQQNALLRQLKLYKGFLLGYAK